MTDEQRQQVRELGERITAVSLQLDIEAELRLLPPELRGVVMISIPEDSGTVTITGLNEDWHLALDWSLSDPEGE